MIRVRGHLTQHDKRFIQYAIKYTLAYVLPERQDRKATVNVLICPAEEAGEENDDLATTCYSIRNRRKRCEVWIGSGLINRRAKKPWARYEKLLTALFHELIHVKQHLTGELVRLSKGRYKFKGRVYRYPDTWDGYYNQPYEVEAYGHEHHLFARFRDHWDQVS